MVQKTKHQMTFLKICSHVSCRENCPVKIKKEKFMELNVT